MQELTQKEILSQKIETMQRSLAYTDQEDGMVIANTIKRLQHKLNELDGVENNCDLDQGFCLSCGS